MSSSDLCYDSIGLTLSSLYLLSLMEDFTAIIRPLGRESVGTLLSFLFVRKVASKGFMKAMFSKSSVLTCYIKC